MQATCRQGQQNGAAAIGANWGPGTQQINCSVNTPRGGCLSTAALQQQERCPSTQRRRQCWRPGCPQGCQASLMERCTPSLRLQDTARQALPLTRAGSTQRPLCKALPAAHAPAGSPARCAAADTCRKTIARTTMPPERTVCTEAAAASTPPCFEGPTDEMHYATRCCASGWKHQMLLFTHAQVGELAWARHAVGVGVWGSNQRSACSRLLPAAALRCRQRGTALRWRRNAAAVEQLPT